MRLTRPRHENHQKPIGREPYEAHVSQHDALESRSEHEAEQMRCIRQKLGGDVHHIAGFDILERVRERATLIGRELGGFEQAIDEMAKPPLGRHPTSRRVGLLNQP